TVRAGKFGACCSRRLPHHRYKTFSSRAQYQLVLAAARKLQESGFYWSALGGKEAGALLGPEPPGTFLVRDSSDHHHFFTLSVKTATGTKNLRIQCDACCFYLQTDACGGHSAPRFDCVLKLIHHYMPGGGAGAAAGGGSAYFIYSGGEKVPLELLRPLSSAMSSLQHLCRKTVNGHIDVSSKREQLPQSLKEFLQEYDAPI
uniref:Suppressor of cytokine signaling 3 n=1 Tax=Denticeps clupeoides TaxID=299321 RepID=A0AAY4EWX8_9TELE